MIMEAVDAIETLRNVFAKLHNPKLNHARAALNTVQDPIPYGDTLFDLPPSIHIPDSPSPCSTPTLDS